MIASMAWLGAILGGLLLLAPTRSPAAPTAPDPLPALIKSLHKDPSYKVRLQAAMTLGRLRDERSVDPLLFTLRADKHPSVRAMAAQALATIGDTDALTGLQAAQNDPDKFVRAQVEQAIVRMGGRPRSMKVAPSGPKVLLAIGDMGDRTRRAREQLLTQMRDFVRLELESTPGVAIAQKGDGGHRRYTIEGAITEMSRKMLPDWVQITCGVSLVLTSHPGGAIVGMTSTSATVEHPRKGYRPDQQGKLEERALQSAVRGAHQSIVPYLSAGGGGAQPRRRSRSE